MGVLKPCQECGGQAKVSMDRMHLAYWCIRCRKCGKTTTKCYKNADDAITEWNGGE